MLAGQNVQQLVVLSVGYELFLCFITVISEFDLIVSL